MTRFKLSIEYKKFVTSLYSLKGPIYYLIFNSNLKKIHYSTFTIFRSSILTTFQRFTQNNSNSDDDKHTENSQIQCKLIKDSKIAKNVHRYVPTSIQNLDSR